MRPPRGRAQSNRNGHRWDLPARQRRPRSARVRTLSSPVCLSSSVDCSCSTLPTGGCSPKRAAMPRPRRLQITRTRAPHILYAATLRIRGVGRPGNFQKDSGFQPTGEENWTRIRNYPQPPPRCAPSAAEGGLLPQRSFVLRIPVTAHRNSKQLSIGHPPNPSGSLDPITPPRRDLGVNRPLCTPAQHGRRRVGPVPLTRTPR